MFSVPIFAGSLLNLRKSRVFVGVVSRHFSYSSSVFLNYSVPKSHIASKTSDPPVIEVPSKDGPFKYCISGPSDATGPLLMAIHGSPGSTYDYRYISPGVESKFRVIRFDTPGHNGSVAPDFLWKDASHTNLAKLHWSYLDTLLANGVITESEHKNIIPLGHSLGHELSARIAAERPKNIAGIASLNGVGLRPHRAIRPPWALNLMAKLVQLPVVGDKVFLPILYSMYINMWGFPKRISHSEVKFCQIRLSKRNYKQFASDIEVIRQNHIPFFMAYSTDDPLIENSVPEEYIHAYLGNNSPLDFSECAPELHLDLSKTEENQKLARNIVLRFTRGGHMLNKEQSAIIGPMLSIWMETISKHLN